MSVTIERDGPITIIVRDRREARNAMDPADAEALTEARQKGLKERGGQALEPSEERPDRPRTQWRAFDG